MTPKKLAEYPKIFHWDYPQKENIHQKVLTVKFVAVFHVDVAAAAVVVVIHVAA
jgi:hypothetical protein